MSKNKIHAIINSLPDNTFQAISKIAQESEVPLDTVRRLYNKGANTRHYTNLLKVKNAINKLYKKKIDVDDLIEA